MPLYFAGYVSQFQSTRPMRGATGNLAKSGGDRQRFNPRAPCGARLRNVGRRPIYNSFNPRAPCGARRVRCQGQSGTGMFQSTRPMRGATREIRNLFEIEQFQSTRPMRGATCAVDRVGLGCVVSIHAPHAGRDFFLKCSKACLEMFQSTRPMRGATFMTIGRAILSLSFNPRAPCGARPL